MSSSQSLSEHSVSFHTEEFSLESESNSESIPTEEELERELFSLQQEAETSEDNYETSVDLLDYPEDGVRPCDVSLTIRSASSYNSQWATSIVLASTATQKKESSSLKCGDTDNESVTNLSEEESLTYENDDEKDLEEVSSSSEISLALEDNEDDDDDGQLSSDVEGISEKEEEELSRSLFDSEKMFNSALQNIGEEYKSYEEVEEEEEQEESDKAGAEEVDENEEGPKFVSETDDVATLADASSKSLYETLKEMIGGPKKGEPTTGIDSLEDEPVSAGESCGSVSKDELVVDSVQGDEEMREENADEYDHEEASDTGRGKGLSPAKPFTAPQPIAPGDRSKPRAGSQLPIPGAATRPATNWFPEAPHGMPPLYPLIPPVPFNGASYEEAFQQWAFWQWTLFGAPWAAYAASGGTVPFGKAPLPSPAPGSHLAFPIPFQQQQPTYHQPAGTYSRSSSAHRFGGGGEMYEESQYGNRRGGGHPNGPNQRPEYGQAHHQQQPFSSANRGGGYNLHSEQYSRNGPLDGRRFENDQPKGRFYNGQQQHGHRGGAFNGPMAGQRDGHRNSVPGRQWNGHQGEDEQMVQGEAAPAPAAAAGGSLWFEFEDTPGDCRLESRPTGPTFNMRGHRGGVGPRGVDGRNNRGIYGGVGRGAAGGTHQRPPMATYVGKY